MGKLGKLTGRRLFSASFFAVYFISVVLGLVLYARVSEWDGLEIEVAGEGLIFLVIAVLLGLISRLLLAWNWSRMLGELSQDEGAPFIDRLRVFAAAWLGRYLPGKIAPIVFRAAKSELVASSRPHVVITSLVETVLQLATYACASIVAVLIFPALRIELSVSILVLGSVAIVLLLATSPPAVSSCARFVSRVKLLPALGTSDVPSYASNLKTVGSASIVTLLNGVGLYFIVLAPQAEANGSFTVSLAIGIAAVASVVSLLAIFAPGGIGVVEFVIITGLVMANLDQASALSVALLWRLVSIVTDLLFWIGPEIVRLTSRLRNRS